MDDETARVEELIRRSGDDLDDALALVGIYVEDKSIVGRDGPAGQEFGVAINGTLGRLAFSPRVQDPEGTAIDEEFSGLTEALESQAEADTHALFQQRLASLRRTADDEQVGLHGEDPEHDPDASRSPGAGGDD